MGSMHRVNFYLTEEQLKILKTLDNLSISEHIRRALDEYLQKLNIQNTSVSLSERISKITDEMVDRHLPDFILGKKYHG